MAGMGGGLLIFGDLGVAEPHFCSSGGVAGFPFELLKRSAPDVVTRADPGKPTKRLPNSGSSGSFSSNAATLYGAGAASTIFAGLPELRDSSDSDEADSGSGSGFFSSGDFGGGGEVMVTAGAPYKFR